MVELLVPGIADDESEEAESTIPPIRTRCPLCGRWSVSRLIQMTPPNESSGRRKPMFVLEPERFLGPLE